AYEDRAAQFRGDALDETGDVDAFELAAGDPDDGVVGGERGGGGVGVGGLRVVHPGDAVGDEDGDVAVRFGAVAADRAGDGIGADADPRGERGGGEGVGDVVIACGAHVLDRADPHRFGAAVVDQVALGDAELAGAGLAQGEADRRLGGGLLGEGGDVGVVEVDDGRASAPDRGLRLGVGVV